MGEQNVVRGPWTGALGRYVVVRVRDEDMEPDVGGAGAYVYADPGREPSSASYVLALEAGRGVVRRFGAVDPRTAQVVGVVVAAVVDLLAS